MLWAGVPQASVDEDCDATLAKHEIGIAKYHGMAMPAGDSETAKYLRHP
jgi:hypothetical protein